MTDDLAAAADANYVESTRIFAEQCCATGASSRLNGLLLTSTGTGVEWLNIAFAAGSVAEAEADLSEAASYYRGLGVPWLLRVPEGAAPAFGRAVAACGLRYTDDVPGMVLAPIPAAIPEPPIEIRPVADADDVAAFARLLGDAFGLAPGDARSVFSDRMLAARGLSAYLGYLDGEPVATSMLIPTDDVAGVWAISTAEAARRRGIGEAVTWHAVERGRELGCTMASLQASEMGQPVYERMGFRTVSRYRTYVSREV